MKPETIKFEKITKDILDSFELNSHEKIIYVVLKSFEHAPRGIRVSLKYLQERTGIKSRGTIIKYLDRLQNLGYVARFKTHLEQTSTYTLDKSKRQESIKRNNQFRKFIKVGIKKKSTKKHTSKSANVINII
jgi:hypothetical protein